MSLHNVMSRLPALLIHLIQSRNQAGCSLLPTMTVVSHWVWFPCRTYV